MMAREFALALDLKEMETPASFAARLARRNGLIPREFCTDLGMRWPDVCSAHPDGLKRLAQLSGANLDALMLTAAPQESNLRFSVGHSQATSGTFRRTVNRVCPRCMTAAIQREGDTGPFQRLEWLLLPLHVCREHHVPLIELKRSSYTHSTLDIVAQTFAQIDHIKAAADEDALTPPMAFEEYLCNRVNHSPAGDWLDGWTLTEIETGSVALGIQMLFPTRRHVSRLTQNERLTAADAGITALAGGPDTLSETLGEMRLKMPVQDQRHYTKVLGMFYVWFRDHRKEPCLSAFREWVRSYLHQEYARRPSQSILGVQARRVGGFSLSEVKRSYGIDPSRVKAILDNLGRYGPDQLRSLVEITEEEAKEVARYWDGLQYPKHTAKALRIFPDQLKALIKNKTRSAVNLGATRQFVERSSVSALLEKLAAVEIGRAGRLHLPLKAHCRNNTVSLARVVAAWARGELTGVRVDPGQEGLQSLLIPRDAELDQQTQRLIGDLTLVEAARYLRTSSTTVLALRKAGLLQTVSCLNPETRFMKIYVAKTSIEAFQNHYTTLGQLARERGVAPIHLARKLDRMGIETIECCPTNVRVYPVDVRRLV
ncbi:TniQ family protein [Shimia ponticola]|uniref:TniQ family protein n=1 Tax=Shimia ponticola TaxID=2582893 RepID=UPI0011BDF1E8|nr:TniQ family protein [Shimia ponticola]